MRPLRRSEIASLERYDQLRDAYRDAVIAHKRARRMGVGENVTLVFEDRDTLRFQVQEMLRVERIADPEKVQQELDVYNELMPGERELSATLFVEITDPERIRAELDRLIGIDEHVSLVLGDEPSADVIPARFDPKQMEEDRLSAVQYIRFALDAKQARLFSDPTVSACLRIAHPAYDRSTAIPPHVRASLAAGLEGEPELLLPELCGGDATPASRVLFRTPRIVARTADPPCAPGHVVVEPAATATSFFDAEQDLLGELLDAARRVARDAKGACRIHIDAGADPLRVHIYTREPD
jgi:hypothetical protein